ncbi:MAG TPA: hypothetical protein VGI40_02690 [Pirellulaceae bacterium]
MTNDNITTASKSGVAGEQGDSYSPPHDCFCHVRACGAICWGADKKHRRELRNRLRSRVHPTHRFITLRVKTMVG